MGMTCTLMRTMLRYNISANLIRGIEQVYDKTISVVQVNGITEEWLIISLNETMPSLAYSLLHFFSRKRYS